MTLNQPTPTSLDQVIRHLAETHAEQTVISYPSPELDFKDYTGAEFERVTRALVGTYPQHLRESTKDAFLSGDFSATPVVAIMGVSNLEYYMTLLALQRLGLTTMVMSPRLADQGFAHLIRVTGCRTVIASGPSLEAMERVKSSSSLDFSLEVIPMVPIESLNLTEPSDLPSDLHPVDPVNPERSPKIIIHTGGTTGLPKPVINNTGGWLAIVWKNMLRFPAEAGMLCTLPVFHAFGFGVLTRSLARGRRLVLLNAERPMTAATILAALDKSGCDSLATVPYLLKIIAEADGGVERLARLHLVQTGGAAVPDDLGELLISKGVKISQTYGQTESGVLMNMSSDEWNWLVPVPESSPYLEFEDVGDGLYHLIILPGHQSKKFTNRPDGSYGTRDLFRKHPTDPGKWKFVARHDDIIVMLNGEKADPVPLEHAVGQNEYVKTAIVFGSGQDALGIIVIPSESAAGLSRVELETKIAPDLEVGNSRVPAYAKVSMDSVIFKEVGTEVPMTAKATVVRSRFLAQFKEDIEQHYAKREHLLNDEVVTPVSDDQVAGLVRRVITSVLQVAEEEAGELAEDADFFSLGMDSLMASRARAGLMREIDLGGKRLASNVAFDHPSIAQLAKHIIDLRKGLFDGPPRSMEAFARELVQKYTSQLVQVETGADPTGLFP